jgi:hypothetical protein
LSKKTALRLFPDLSRLPSKLLLLQKRLESGPQITFMNNSG